MWRHTSGSLLQQLSSFSSHPLHETVQSCSFSKRLLHPACKKERFRRSFIPSAIRLYNTSVHFGSHSSYPDLPGGVTFDQLEVLAQVVVGGEADLEYLDGASISREAGLGTDGRMVCTWTGHLPGQRSRVPGHNLIHSQGRVALIPTSS